MSDNIKVAIRLRALIEREQRSGQSVNWVIKDNSITQVEENGRIGKPYNFDKIFDQQMTTYDIFEDICKPIVDAAIEGFHGTVFAYGQSSSGKTFTMSGTKVQPGVVPLAINEIFYQIESASDREFLMRVSYLEIYNEKISDLLSDEDKIIKLNEDSPYVRGPVLSFTQELQSYFLRRDHNVQLVNVIEEVVNESAQVFDVIKKGDLKRHVAETKQNDRSSRSHCILRIIIESRSRHNPGEDAVMVSHLNFVDLAGSEKAAENTGVRFREGCAINKSLLTLGQVIHKLSGDESTTHVSYRDSKLTRILQNALGGNSKTAILCTITPASIEESHSTLKFASRAKTIRNKPHLNEVLSDAAMLKKYQREISRLQNQISEMGNLHEMHMQKEDLEKKLQEKEEAEEKQKNLIEKLRQMVVISKTGIAGQEPVPRKKRRMTWCPGKKASTFGPSFAELQALPEISPPGSRSMFLEDESFRKSTVMFRPPPMILEEDSPEKTELLSTTIGTNDALKELFELQDKYETLLQDHEKLQSEFRTLEEFTRLEKGVQEEEEKNFERKMSVFGSGIIELEEQMEKVIGERDFLKKEVTTLKERLKVVEEKALELPPLSAGSTHQEWLEKFHAEREKHDALVTELQQELDMCKMELELERNQKQCNTSVTGKGTDEDNTAIISATIVPEVEREVQLLQDERDYYHNQVEELEEKLREASSVHSSNNETSICDFTQASKLSETMAELSDAQSRQVELEEMLKESQTEMEELEISLQTMKVSIERLANENEHLQEANKRLKTELQDFAERHVFENEQIEEANKRLKTEKFSLQNRVDNLEERVQLHSDTVHDIQEEQKISEGVIADLKAEISRLHESRSVEDVEQKYETRLSELEETYQRLMLEKEEEQKSSERLIADLKAEISRLQESRSVEDAEQKYETRLSELEVTYQRLMLEKEEEQKSSERLIEDLKAEISRLQESRSGEDVEQKYQTRLSELEETYQRLMLEKEEEQKSSERLIADIKAEISRLQESRSVEDVEQKFETRLSELEETYQRLMLEKEEEQKSSERLIEDLKAEISRLQESRSVEDAEQKYETRLSELEETYQRLMLEKEEEQKSSERLIADLKAEISRLQESRSVEDAEQKYETRLSELEETYQRLMLEKEEEQKSSERLIEDLKAEISRLQESRSGEDVEQKYKTRLSELEETYQRLMLEKEEEQKSSERLIADIKAEISRLQESRSVEDVEQKYETRLSELEETYQRLMLEKEEEQKSPERLIEDLKAEISRLQESRSVEDAEQKYETRLSELEETYQRLMLEKEEEQKSSERLIADLKAEISRLQESRSVEDVEQKYETRLSELEETYQRLMLEKEEEQKSSERLIADLKAEISRLQESRSVEDAEQKYETRISELEVTYQRLKSEKEEEHETLVRLNTDLKAEISRLQESRDIENTQQKYEIRISELEETQQRLIAENEEKKRSHMLESEDLQIKINTLEERIAVYIEAMEEFQEEEKKVQEELIDLRYKNLKMSEELAEHTGCKTKISGLESQCIELTEKVVELCRTKQHSQAFGAAIDDEIYHPHHDCQEGSLRQKLEEAEKRVSAYTEAMTEFQEEHRKVQEEISDLRHENSQLREELGKHKMTLEEPDLHAECQFKISGLESQCQDMTERVSVYSETMKEFQEEQKKMQEELSDLRYKNSQLREELADHTKCQAKISSLESQCTQLNEKVKDLSQKSLSPDAATDDEISYDCHDCEKSLRQKLQEAELRVSAYTEAMTEFQEEHRKIQEEISDLRHENSQLREELGKHKMTLEEPDLHAECQFKISGLESQCQDMTEQLEVYSETVHELKEENEMLEKKITELKAKIFSFQDNTNVEDLQQKYETEISELKETQQKLISETEEQKRYLLESAHLQEKIKILEEELEISKMKKQEVDDQLFSYQKKCQKLETEVEKMKECQKSLESLQLKVIEEERKVEIYKETVTEFQEEKSQSEKEMEELKSDLCKLKNHNKELQKTFEDCKTSVTELNTKCQQLESGAGRASEFERERDNLQQALLEAEEELEISKMKKQEVDDQLFSYQKKCQKLETEVEKMKECQKSLESLQLKVIEEERELEILGMKRTEADEQINRYQEKIQILEAEAEKWQEYETNLETLQLQLIEEEKKVEIYKETVTEFQEEKSQSEKEMEELKSDLCKLKNHNKELQKTFEDCKTSVTELNTKCQQLESGAGRASEFERERDNLQQALLEAEERVSAYSHAIREFQEEQKKLKQETLKNADSKALADENLRLKKLIVQKENHLREMDRQRNSGTASESYALTSAREEIETLKKKNCVLMKDLKEMKELTERAEVALIGPLPEMSQGSNINWESNWKAFCRAEASKRSVLLSSISELKEELRKAKYVKELARELVSEYEEREKNSTHVKELQTEVEKYWQQLSTEEEKNITLTQQLLEEQNKIRTLEERMKQMEQKPGENPKDSENVKKLEDKVRQLEDKVREYISKCFSLDRKLQKAEERLSEYKESADVYEERISRMKKEMRRLANADASFIGYDPRSQPQEPITPQMTTAPSQSLMMGSVTKDKTPATIAQTVMTYSGSSDCGNSSQGTFAGISSLGGIANIDHGGSSSRSGISGISSGSSSSRGGSVDYFHMCLLEGQKKELEKDVKSLKSKIQKLELEKNEIRKPADTESNKKRQELEQENVGLKSQLTNERAEIQKLKEDLKSASSLCTNCSSSIGSTSVVKHPLEDCNFTTVPKRVVPSFKLPMLKDDRDKLTTEERERLVEERRKQEQRDIDRQMDAQCKQQ